jgi:leader peptidase (prepilin peptidase)/N-methyltransferase
MLLFLLPSFAMGAALGSFLAVLVDRLSTGRSFVKGRSYCESCKKTLQAIDLVPVFSYIVLLGKCRFCKKKIPFRLFLIELVTALLASTCFYLAITGIFSITSAILIFIILYLFFGIFVADIIYGIIPDFFSLAALIVSFFYVYFQRSPMIAHGIAGLSCFAFFLTLFVITKGRGMGFGDVKLSFILGFLLGYPLIIVSLYLAFLTGAAVAIILVVCRKTKFFGGSIPFGPFLVASTVISLFYGQEILRVFLARFFP